MNCPICNKEITLSTTFCDQCSFEIHNLPDGVSDAVKIYENERIEKYNILRQQISESKKLSDLLAETRNQVKAAENIVNEQTKEINNVQKEKVELQIQSSELKKNLDAARNEVQSLKSQLEKAIEDGKHAQLDGIVRVVKTNYSGSVLEECYLPIYQGLNTYGIGTKQQGNHHTIGLRRTPIAEEHFTIEKNRSGQIVLRPLNGEAITCDGRTIHETGVAVESHHRINIGNTIEIHVSTL